MSSISDFVIENGVLTKYLGDDSKVVIPEGVSSISEWAFGGRESIMSIDIPKSVTSIDLHAFVGCTSLTSIEIPSSVASVNGLAFNKCRSLASIKVDTQNPVYHSENNCLIDTKRKTLILGCKNSIIPSDGSVTSIGAGAFSGCISLTGIEIPSSITSIGEDAFKDCASLARIAVDTQNPVYHSENNCLIDTKRKNLLLGCKNSIIPSDGSVTSIGDYAFECCIDLVSIEIPSSITSIGEAAFAGSTSLTSVDIPSSVKKIGADAFEECAELVIKGYGGSYAEKYAEANEIPFVTIE